MSEETHSENTGRLFSPIMIRPEPMWWVAGGQGREHQEQNRQRRAFPLGSSLSLALSSSSSSILRTYEYLSSSSHFQVGTRLSSGPPFPALVPCTFLTRTTVFTHILLENVQLVKRHALSCLRSLHLFDSHCVCYTNHSGARPAPKAVGPFQP